MDGVFKRKLTRYVIEGKRVPKGTPGAKAETSDSREWYALVRGKYVKLSPRRDVAEKLLRQKLHEIEDLKVNRFAMHQQTPLAEHVAAFREHLEAQARAPRYFHETIGRLAILTTNCERLEHVTAAKVNKVLNELSRQGRGTLKKKKIGAGPATRNSYLAAAKSFCQWCVDDRRLPDNPLAHQKKVNERVDVSLERRTLTEDEFGKLVDAAEQSKEIVRELSGPDRAMLYAFAVGTGLRASEIASLSTESLELDADPPLVIVEAAISKRRQREEQPIPTWLADRLRTWLAKRPSQPTLMIQSEQELLWPPEMLWPGSWRRHAAEVLRADLAAAGIDYRDSAGRTFDFHALRHQYISNLAAAGVHPKIAQTLARHSDINLTLKRYTHLGLHDQTGAVQSLPAPQSPRDRESRRATGTDDRVFDHQMVTRR